MAGESTAALMDGNQSDPNAADPNAADPNAADPTAADPNAADPNAADPNAADPNAADPNAADPNAADPNAADPKAQAITAEMLKESGVSQDVIDVFLPITDKLTPEDVVKLTAAGNQLRKQSVEDTETYWKNKDEEWHKQLQDDAEFGGDKLGANTAKVNFMLKTFDTDGELTKELEEIQHQNWPALFKFITRVSGHFQEDFFVKGGDNANKEKLPPHMTMGYKKLEDY